MSVCHHKVSLSKFYLVKGRKAEKLKGSLYEKYKEIIDNEIKLDKIFNSLIYDLFV